MSQRKPEGQHAGGRRKSENRQRQNLVAVRFSPEEYRMLRMETSRTGKPMAALLREAFLATVRIHENAAPGRKLT